MGRHRHVNKEAELVLQAAEAAGWTFERRGDHLLGKCSCGKHTVTVPQRIDSRNRGVQNLAGVLKRCKG